MSVFLKYIFISCSLSLLVFSVVSYFFRVQKVKSYEYTTFITPTEYIYVEPTPPEKINVVPTIVTNSSSDLQIFTADDGNEYKVDMKTGAVFTLKEDWMWSNQANDWVPNPTKFFQQMFTQPNYPIYDVPDYSQQIDDQTDKIEDLQDKLEEQASCQKEIQTYMECVNKNTKEAQEYNECMADTLNESSWRYRNSYLCTKPYTMYCYKPACSY